MSKIFDFGAYKRILRVRAACAFDIGGIMAIAIPVVTLCCIGLLRRSISNEAF